MIEPFGLLPGTKNESMKCCKRVNMPSLGLLDLDANSNSVDGRTRFIESNERLEMCRAELTHGSSENYAAAPCAPRLSLNFGRSPKMTSWGRVILCHIATDVCCLKGLRLGGRSDTLPPSSNLEALEMGHRSRFETTISLTAAQRADGAK